MSITSYTHVCMYVCIYTYMYTCMYVCMYIYIYIYMYVSIYAYIYIYIYILEDAEDTRETRHLQSRKKYYYNFALWSTKAIHYNTNIIHIL